VTPISGRVRPLLAGEEYFTLVKIDAVTFTLLP
jgi:hypothetical protein